jgi:hypothetical protein
MKRDMDLIREFLLKIEAGQSDFEFLSEETAAILGTTSDSGLTTKEADHQEYNFQLLIDAGLIEGGAFSGGCFYADKITWSGHDFLDSVRNPETWAKAKKGALAAGGFTLDILKDLAKGLIKKQDEEHTGVKL